MPRCPPLSQPASYPYNLDFDFGALEGLTRYSINNLGDPFIESNYGVHSREFEVRGARARGGCGARVRSSRARRQRGSWAAG